MYWGKVTSMRKSNNTSGYRVQSVVPAWISRVLQAIPPELSATAKQRLHWVDFSKKFGVAMAAAAAQVSERTIKRWRKALQQHGLRGLEPRSRAPKSHRGPQWTPADVEAVRAARNSEAGRGKGKEILQRLIAATGRVLSVSTVGRILTYLKDRGEIREPHRTVKRKVRNPRPYAIRRPKGFPPPTQPGDLVQIDTVHLRPLPGVELRQFSAIDVVTRLAVTDVRTTATARTARDHLYVFLESLPFEVRTIQVDGGSEFMAEFEAACKEHGIGLHVLPPNSPKLNGCVERFNRTTRDEFWAWYTGTTDLATVRPAMQRWTSRYNALRLHTSLGYVTPLDALQSFQGT